MIHGDDSGDHVVETMIHGDDSDEKDGGGRGRV